MIYDTKIGERCDTMRTWFDRGVNRLHRLHRLFSCQRKLLLPTDNTDNTKFSWQQKLFLPTDNTDNTKFLFSQQKLFLPTDNTDNTKFFSQQITLITQKIKFVLFVLSVGKTKKIREICVIRWQNKTSCSSCYPLAKEKIREICVIRWQNKTSCSSCYPLAKQKNQCNLCNPLIKKSPAILTDGRAWQK